MVTGASTNPALTQQGFGNVFRNMYSDALQGPAGATAAWTRGYRKAYVVDDSTPYGEGLSYGFYDQFTEYGGTVAGTAKTSDMDTDFTALVAAIKVVNPDVVYYGGIYNAGALFAKQLRDAGVTAPVVGGDGLYDSTFIALGGAQVTGDMATSAGYPVAFLPDGVGFKSMYAARFPGIAMTDYDAYSYDSANVIMAAIIAEAQARGVGAVGIPSAKRSIIARIAATDTMGATGRIRFDVTGERRDPVFSVYRVTGGAWVYQE
jgi:branched-chain amino acid transport system substrate-binding protein